MKLTVNIKKVIKNAIIISLCVASITSSVLTCIPVAKADSSDILGSKAALGSPLLNENFVVDDWNKWEMICWGVYLSNFCVPLIDDYNSAFKTGAGGSDGRGLKALCFGSGSDPANNRVVTALCDEAIKNQKVNSRDIYVRYEVGNANKSSYPSAYRKATFRDLFFQIPYSSDGDSRAFDATSTWKEHTFGGTAWIEKKFLWIEGPVGCVEGDITGYSDMNGIYCLNLPTFYIQESPGNYVKIFDYANSWDVQMMGLILNSVPEELKSKWMDAFVELWDANNVINLDSFANITVNGKVVLPAALNQHITKDEKINLLNSWVFNAYINTTSEDDLILGTRQLSSNPATYRHWYDIYNLEYTRFSNGPALNETTYGNVALLYYDTDSIVMQDYVSKGNYDVDYGDILLKLFDCSIHNKVQTYPLKIEVGSGETMSTSFNTSSSRNKYMAIINNTRQMASMVPNEVYRYTDHNDQSTDFLSEIVLPNGKTTKPLFSSNAVAIANQYLAQSKKDEIKKPTKQGAMRYYYNFLYKQYLTTNSAINVKIQLQNIHKVSDGRLSNSYNEESGLFTYFTYNNWGNFRSFYQQYKQVDAPIKMDKGGWCNFWEDFGGYFVEQWQTYANAFGSTDKWEADKVLENTSRVILAYPVSEQMKRVSEVLSIKDGAEFATYCTYIYMTYLDWYGIGKTVALGQDDYSEFDPAVFDESNNPSLTLDPYSALPDAMSAEDKEAEILNLGYLMLSPEAGREYRKNLIYNGIEDFIYEQYNRIVYGGKDSMYNGAASKSNSGFLAVETFDSNFLTSWFLEYYTDIVIWMIMGILLAIFVVGILKKRKLSWFALNIIVAINAILLVPSSGEIVPYTTSRFVQDMFSKKMTFWAVSEGITNAAMEKDLAAGKNTDGLSDDEALVVTYLVKNLSTLYTDRSLMLKQDISQKVTQQTKGIYSRIQEIQSARWILPMVMQQFTGDNETTEYLYVKLANVYDDMSNLYWYYNPEDSEFVTTATATSDEKPIINNGKATTWAGVENKKNDESGYMYNTTCLHSQSPDYYSYLNIYEYDKENLSPNKSYNYRCVCYDTLVDSTLGANSIYMPVNRTFVHQNAYIIENDFISIPSRIDIFGMGSTATYKNADSWQTYIDYAVANLAGSVDSWRTDADYGFENTADQYDRTQRSSMGTNLSYLRHTENVAYYFYNVIKDSFNGHNNVNIASVPYSKIITELQGQVKQDADRNDLRASFMHAYIGDTSDDDEVAIRTRIYTGYVRDILDLEELFTHTIPYLYQVQLITGGFDNESGILVDADGNALEIKELQFYEGMPQAWLYRCNWATKIMENPEYCKPTTVKDSSGNKYDVPNPLLPECYPASRPMIFSEAQMHLYGLKEADLSMVELKCIEVNKNTCDKWTLLVNYAGTKGITKEVLFRQMAIDAALTFNSEFGTNGVLNSLYKLYPTTIDLRYLSFDSVMKMLMMNISKNTGYTYGDTMQTLISDSDMFTAVLLLVDAAVCAWFIPLVQDILLAMIFYLGFAAIIRAIFSSGKTKAKIASGQLICNALFMVITIGYYACFSLLMAVSTTDEVLSVKTVSSNPGNPIWALLAILIFSIIYIWLVFKEIKFCWQNYKDMGFEAYQMIAGGVAEKISGGLARISNGLTAWSQSLDESEGIGTGNTNSISGTGKMNSSSTDVRITSTDKSAIKLENIQNATEESIEDYAQQAYQSTDDIEYYEVETSDSINAEIELGREMSDNDI